MVMTGEFYTFDEVLKRLGIDETKLKRLVSEGEIRAFREGDQMKFRRGDVENLDLDGHEKRRQENQREQERHAADYQRKLDKMRANPDQEDGPPVTKHKHLGWLVAVLLIVAVLLVAALNLKF